MNIKLLHIGKEINITSICDEAREFIYKGKSKCDRFIYSGSAVYTADHYYDKCKNDAKLIFLIRVDYNYTLIAYCEKCNPVYNSKISILSQEQINYLKNILPIEEII